MCISIKNQNPKSKAIFQCFQINFKFKNADVNVEFG